MLDLVESCQNLISERELNKTTKHLQTLIAQSDQYRIQQYEATRIFPPCRNEDNGFASLSLPRLKNLLLLILNKCGEVWVTKMNKLLFYIDFAFGDYDGCVLLTENNADETLFTEQELKVIDHICETFKNCSSRDLSAISHFEEAWALNHENAQRIPFLQAFTLKAV